MFRLTMTFAILCVGSAALQAQTRGLKIVLLNDGRVITGSVVAGDGTTLTVKTDDGTQTTVKKSQIEEIRDRTTRAQASPSDLTNRGARNAATNRRGTARRKLRRPLRQWRWRRPRCRR